MDALPGPSPLVITGQPVPRARRSKDLAEALSEDRQGAGGDVPVLLRGCQVLDRLDLGGRELLG